MKKGLPLIEGLARLVLAGIFLWAGLSKLADPQSFANGITTFQLFPEWSVNLLALTVPMLELAAAVLLLSGRWTRQGALLSIFLALAFATLFAWALLHGLNVLCSCFGHNDTPDSPIFGLIRAVVIYLIALAVYLIRMFRKIRRPDFSAGAESA